MTKTIVTLHEYEELVNQAPILSWRANADAHCDYFNERWLSYRGRSLDEERGTGWAEGVHPEDYDRCLKTYREAFEKREVFEIEYRLKRHDGVYKWVFDVGTPFYTKEGEFAGYIGTCHVVSDKVDVLDALNDCEVRKPNPLKRCNRLCKCK